MSEKPSDSAIEAFAEFMRTPEGLRASTGVFKPRQLGYMAKPGYAPRPVTVMLGDGRLLEGEEAERFLSGPPRLPRLDSADATD